MNDLFAPEIILESEKVLLRPLDRADLEAYIHYAETEPDTWQYSLLPAHGRENMTTYVEHALAAREKRDSYPFTVIDKASGKIAGSTRFYDVQPTYGYLQLGYTWYGKDFRGTGLNTHCKFLLLEHAFERWNMARVEFRADNRNERSKAAMQKIGCTIEGVIRSHMPNLEGGRRDSILLSILKEEWEENVKDNLLLQMHNS